MPYRLSNSSSPRIMPDVVPPVSDASSPFVGMARAEWARLRDATPLTLTETDLRELQGINERLSLDEVAEVYLPLSRLLNLHVSATQALHATTDVFLGRPSRAVPFVIGIAGSVAVGKSTTARILQALLSRWGNHPRVDLVTTDGFLHPNAVLEARGLMHRKGFPESYDVKRLVQFVHDVKSGVARVEAPVYNHIVYDILPGETIVVEQPDVLIVEGLNVLQGPGRQASAGSRARRVFVSDYFDFSIYVDAPEPALMGWYVDRFLRFRESVFRDPRSYFKRFAELTEREAVETARKIWTDINGANLRQNIAPTKERATLILEKGEGHAVERVRLRKR